MHVDTVPGEGGASRRRPNTRRHAFMKLRVPQSAYLVKARATVLAPPMKARARVLAPPMKACVTVLAYPAKARVTVLAPPAKSRVAFPAQSAKLFATLALVAQFSAVASADAGQWSEEARAALSRAGTNRAQIAKALDSVQGEELDGMEFLIAHMPPEDLASLSSAFLVENVALAYEAKRVAPWGREVPENIFLDALLPYSVIDERRDPWRRELRELCLPLVKDARTSGEAATILNRELFPLVGVRYDVTRSRNNQSAREVMQEKKATCSGLSILLIDACRSVGVPARFAGTPLWADSSGNHSWVEIWEHGWHYTGAAEPTGDRLDEAWFTERAAGATSREPAHAIYAILYRPTGVEFPHEWPGAVKALHALDVTERYASGGESLAPAPGMSRVEIIAFDRPGGRRVAVEIAVLDEHDGVVFAGVTSAATADMRNNLTAHLPRDREYRVRARVGESSVETMFVADAARATWIFSLMDESARLPQDQHRWGRRVPLFEEPFRIGK